MANSPRPATLQLVADDRKAALIAALQLLAAEPPQQLIALATFRRVADEVLARPSNGGRLEVGLAQEGQIPTSAAELIDRLDDIFAELIVDDRDELWTPEALRTAEAWQRARVLARRALMALDIERTEPAMPQDALANEHG